MSEMYQKQQSQQQWGDDHSVHGTGELHFAMFPFGVFTMRKASRTQNMFREEHENCEGSGVQVSWGGVEGTGIISPGEQEAQGRSHCSLQLPERWSW